MLNPFRILLADDSAVVRRLLSQTLSKHADLQVVGTARNGLEAVKQVSETAPEVVILDVEMPVMDGLTALKHIRQKNRWLPVVMFSSLTVSGARTTLDALSIGANDYVAKPSSSGQGHRAMEYVENELLPRLRYWGQKVRTVKASPVRMSRADHTVHASEKRPRHHVEIVAIGASTGGPNALSEILRRLPPNLNVPVLIVQHMPAVFTQLLAERLNQQCPLDVREARDGDSVRPGRVLIAPGDYHMTVCGDNGKRTVSLNRAALENSCRPSVDVLFRSIAELYREKSMAVILTGMGQDGAKGCEWLHRAGAYIVVQDEETSVVWGMPQVVAKAGFASRIRPLSEISNEIAMSAQYGAGRSAASAGSHK